MRSLFIDWISGPKSDVMITPFVVPARGVRMLNRHICQLHRTEGQINREGWMPHCYNTHEGMWVSLKFIPGEKDKGFSVMARTELSQEALCHNVRY